MHSEALHWIKELKLEAHPEGGFFHEVYRSKERVSTDQGERNLSTSIYFLLAGDQKSHFHQLESDELWYFHAGTPVKVHLFEGKSYRQELLGLGEGLPQLLLPARSVFAAEVVDKTGFCLMGCMVNPGFDFKDFRMVGAEELKKEYPEHTGLIEEFTLE